MVGFSKQSKYPEGDHLAHLAKHSLPTRGMGLGEPFCNQEVSKEKFVIVAFGLTDALLSLVGKYFHVQNCGNSLERFQLIVCIPVCSLNKEDGFTVLAPIPSNKVVERLHNSANNVFLVSAVRLYVNFWR
jgi:hypothetical protein